MGFQHTYQLVDLKAMIISKEFFPEMDDNDVLNTKWDARMENIIL